MEKKMTMKDVREAVIEDSMGRNKKGNIIVRRGFFYTNGMTAQKFADRISNDLTDKGIKHMIVDKGECWKPFKGGASIKNQSHWWVEIELNN